MKVKAVDVGYGNVKICHGETDNEEMLCSHFPSIAKAHTGIDRGASVMTKRDLIEVESGESIYMVGKDSIDTLSARDDRIAHLQTNYIDTPQYLALYRGALAYMNEENIDLLVSGLPVNNYAQDKARMRELLMGNHKYQNGKSVTVKDVWVIPQPVGGFIDFFMNNNDDINLDEIMSLTLDVGYYTLDWLTCRGLKMNEERSSSTPGGMSLILEKLTQLIAVDRKDSFSNIGMVDAGIQKGFKTRIQGVEYDFSHLIPKMEDHITTAIQSVVRSVGSLDDIDVILLVGGGAKCYQGIFEKVLGREIIVPDSSIYSNVKGFYLAGKQRAASIGA